MPSSDYSPQGVVGLALTAWVEMVSNTTALYTESVMTARFKSGRFSMLCASVSIGVLVMC